MRKAYSYQRFSSIKQKDGDSIKRQTDAAESFCKQFGLHLVNTFRDEGVSSFKGKNFSHESALGQFLRLVDSGSIENRAVLIVENMDRLSRQSILPCLSKFIDIINKDIGIGVVSHNKVFDKKSITENPMELMLVLVEFSRAGSESMAKSLRLKSHINSKLERVRNGEKLYFGAQKPTWIIGATSGKFIIDEQRMKLVKDIFSRYLSGASCSKIANDLNATKTKTLRGTKGGIWTNSTVREILKNKNVVGWMGINGTEIENYFPPIISEKDFQLTQSKLAFNVKNRGGSPSGLVRNLFKSLLFCSECGEPVETKLGSYKSVKGETRHYADYICRGVKYGNDCKNYGRLPVLKFETNFFDFIFMAKINKVDSQHNRQGNGRLEDLENQLAKIQRAIERITDLLADDELQDIGELKSKMVKLNTESKMVKKAIEIENSKIVSQMEEPHAVKSLLKLKERTELGMTITDIEERKKARNLMPSLYRKVTLKFGEKDTTAIFYGLDGNADTMTLKK